MLEGSILQQLKDAHSIGDPRKRSLNFGVYYKNTLVALCHALEDSILETDMAPLVITAFQRGKWYLEEAERYADIADQSQQIVIMAADDAGFAEHPTSQRSNVALVALDETDAVSQEWHLIIVSPNYTAMVLCQELSESDYRLSGLPQTDLERKFYGFWTFEPNLVMETAEMAIAHIQRYNPELHQKLTTQLQTIVQNTDKPETVTKNPIPLHLGSIVSRVVDYLRTHQETLDQDQFLTGLQVRHRHRSLDQNLTSNELQAFLRVAQLMDQADLSNPMSGAEVATLAEAMGQLLDLPAWQLHRLRLAGLLHRLAFLYTDQFALDAQEMTVPAEEEDRLPLTCSLIPGVQVLRTMPRLRAIATILTHQTEWWNGTGQPAGLTGDEIPLESRVLGLVAEFQRQLALRRQAAPDASAPLSGEDWYQAFAACQTQYRDRWDPKLLDTLELLVNGLRHGLQLPIAFPKIAAGLWMLDSHSNEDPLVLGQSTVSAAGSSSSTSI
jgi:DICT domain-containing protein